MPCNRGGFEYVDSNYFYDHYKIYLKDDTVSDLTALSGATSTVAAGAYAILVDAGYIASLSTPVTAGLAACLAVEMAWLDIANDGCGVIIDLFIVENYSSTTPYLNDIPVHYISSQ